MTRYIFDWLREFLAHYGYWAVAATLLLENSGLPLPGETILLLASAAAAGQHKLHLPYVILVAVAAATCGDNLGFLIGHYGGRPLLMRYGKTFHLSSRSLAYGEEIIHRYGGAAVLAARFIAGLRIIAGPLAGVLRMPWKRFVIFNFLGAALWVAVISSVGYFFGAHWEELARLVREANIGLLLAALVVLALLWRRWRKLIPRT